MKHPLDAPRAGSDAEQTRAPARQADQDQRRADAARREIDGPAGQRLLAVPDRHHARRPGARAHRGAQDALSRLERTNDELTTARDASERANRFKTRFFTAVGHDLLQPLHAARLSVSALTDPSSTPDQRRLADRIEHALTTIEELLKSILDISKLEAGVIVPTLRPVPLDELFASLVLDIEPLARLKNLALDLAPQQTSRSSPIR